MSGFERSRTTGGLVHPSEELLAAVKQLSEKSGHPFEISPDPVPGTTLFVVHTLDHPFRPEYTVAKGVFGFRAPFNFPDAAPEDSFFIAPVEVRLARLNPVRNSIDVNRASRAENVVTGSSLGNLPVLMFSWHLWDRVPWNRRTHTLVDHYTHCIRRFEQVEND
jgi:hypothetical protein